jgi:hypothetical protein
VPPFGAVGEENLLSGTRPIRRSVVIPTVAARVRKEKYPAPREFRPARDTPPGRFPLLSVFQGLERTIPFQKYPGDDATTLHVAQHAWAHISDGPGWMYVAPTRTPPEVRAAGFRMVESREDEIVVARGHLVNSPSMDLYLDIIHEFLHILQRRQGRALWLGAKVSYVDRPTEVEAYSYSVAEARRLGVPDSYLRKYLEVTWVRKSEYLRLLRHLGVSTK